MRQFRRKARHQPSACARGTLGLRWLDSEDRAPAESNGACASCPWCMQRQEMVLLLECAIPWAGGHPHRARREPLVSLPPLRPTGILAWPESVAIAQAKLGWHVAPRRLRRRKRDCSCTKTLRRRKPIATQRGRRVPPSSAVGSGTAQPLRGEGPCRVQEDSACHG